MSGADDRREPRTNGGYSYREHIGPDEEGRTVWEHLSSSRPHSSRETWEKRIELGEVRLDGRLAGKTDRLVRGQVLVWDRPPWIEPLAPLDFALLHEDPDLLAVAKPSGLPTLPGGGYLENTLLWRVRRVYPEASPLHRLGRGTSGLVLFSRNAKASRALARIWHDGVRKTYLALVRGRVEEKSFAIDAPIGRVPHDVLGAVHAATARGRPSRSHVRVMERFEKETLVEVDIITGRPHQIRIHMAAAGYPLVDDPLYPPGGVPSPTSRALPGDCGYLLHSARLAFRHPRTRKALVIYCAPPPRLCPGHAPVLDPGKGMGQSSTGIT